MESKTTSVFAKAEFWLTVVTSVAGLLLAFGVITPEQNEGIATYAPNLIGAILSILSTFKFINVQHAARVEVFRAMCATNLEKAAMHSDRVKDGAGDDGVSPMAVAGAAQGEVAAMAKAVGL